MLDYLAPNYSGRLLYLNDFELSVHGEKKWRFISRYIILVDDCLWSQALSKTTVVVPCLLDNTVQFWKGKTAQSKSLTNIRTPTKHSDICQKLHPSTERLQKKSCKDFSVGQQHLEHPQSSFAYSTHTKLSTALTSSGWTNLMYSKYQTWCISRYTFCGRYHFNMRRKKNDAPSAISFLKSSWSNQVPICRHHRTNSIIAGFVRTHLAYTYWWLDTTTSFKMPCMAQTLGCLTDDWLAKPFEHMSIR
jgi:hypothetical protein